jgi:tetratricopeptide (TPR) repeat protein
MGLISTTLRHFALLSALLAVLAQPLFAQELRKPGSRAFQALYEDARVAYDAGQFADAAKLLQKAYDIEPDPALLWNMGRSYEKAELLEEAIAAYAKFAKDAPTPEERQDGAARLLEVKARFGKGWLTVRTDTPGARVQVDIEEEVDPPIVRKLLPAGEHWVTVTAPGMAASRTRVGLQPGEEAEINVKLVGVSQPLAVMTPQPVSTLSSSSTSNATMRTWGWVSIGVGAAFAAGGATLMALGFADKAEVEDARANAEGAVVGVTRAQALDLSDSAELKSGVGIGLLAAGGAGLITGIVLLVVGDEADPVYTWASPTPTGFALGGTF